MNKGLFFDLDGTLADNLHVMYAVYETFLEARNRTATQQEFDILNGPPLPEVVRRLKSTHSLDGDVDRILEDYNHTLDEFYLQARAADGAREALIAAKTKGWTIGVVTSNAFKRASGWLDKNGIMPLVDLIVSGDQCLRGKPAPDIYLMALDKAKCSVSNAFAVEDSLQGVQSALAAGLKTISYIHGRNNHVTFPVQALRLENFKDLFHLIEYDA